MNTILKKQRTQPEMLQNLNQDNMEGQEGSPVTKEDRAEAKKVKVKIKIRRAAAKNLAIIKVAEAVGTIQVGADQKGIVPAKVRAVAVHLPNSEIEDNPGTDQNPVPFCFSKSVILLNC
jgi:hypothetical protein